ncbi:MAG TPA: hypothetical protein VEK56_06260, partial [Vicinamibacterales bacterium]|nr:hypothetical protein [Vicinamibacterales bacterium]
MARSMKLLGWAATTTFILMVLPVLRMDGAAQQSARVAPDVYSNLKWRTIGPEGNRISAVAGVPGDPLVYYAGSASGGIAKST